MFLVDYFEKTLPFCKERFRTKQEAIKAHFFMLLVLLTFLAVLVSFESVLVSSLLTTLNLQEKPLTTLLSFLVLIHGSIHEPIYYLKWSKRHRPRKLTTLHKIVLGACYTLLALVFALAASTMI